MIGNRALAPRFACLAGACGVSETCLSFRDKLKEHRREICKAFSKLDRSKTGGFLSLCKLQKLLQEGGCYLKEEELTHLLNRCP